MYDEEWQAENEEQQGRRILRKIQEIDVEFVQNLMNDVCRKLRLVEEHGFFYLCSLFIAYNHNLDKVSYYKHIWLNIFCQNY